MSADSVRFEVLHLDLVQDGGPLVALAAMLVELEGAVLVLRGVQLLRRPDGMAEALAPVFRHPRDGQLKAALMLPSEICAALAAEVRAKAAGVGGFRQ